MEREREREIEITMADDFQSRICSGGSWWNLARSAGLDGTASVSCSTAITDMGGGGFSWATAELAEPKARSGEESAGSVSGSSVSFQDTPKLPPSDVGPSVIDSTLQMPGFSLSTQSIDWTQALLLVLLLLLVLSSLIFTFQYSMRTEPFD